jgi:Sulfotransferase domain
MAATGAIEPERGTRETFAPAKEQLDFIVIGAQKSATTTLFEHLRRHPEVEVPSAKEAPFFSHDEIYRRGWRAYLEGLVVDGHMGDPDKKWGTVTPQYMTGGVLSPARDVAPSDYDERTVPRRIHEQIPDVRLVAILRDPIERAISHHGMLVRRGGERRDFDEAVEQLLRPEALRAARAMPREATGYIAWGEYGRILQGYLDVFPSPRLLVLFTEELEQAPLEVLARLYGFIGVSEGFVAPNAGERFRVARDERGFAWLQPGSWLSPASPFSPQGLQRAVRRAPGVRPAWRALPLEMRRRILRPYSRVAVRARSWNRSRPVGDGIGNAAPRAETIERLREHFAEDTARLTAMLGGSAPHWGRGGG